ncbi:MAG: Hydroxypyruvate reductase [Bacteroidia bacterium]|nr:Hydroxypyruvate reductase [Bacteroidia bacterium]
MIVLNKNILFLDTVHTALRDELKKIGCHCELDDKSSKEEIERKIGDYDGLVIRSRIKIDAALIDKATRLKFIARAGAGMENIDVEYAARKKIKCIHAPEGNRDAVGEHALGMLLSLMNNLNKADREVREGKWLREENRGHELMFKTVGIIGYGNMGSAFARRLNGFSVMAMAYDKYKKNFGDDFIIEANMEALYEEAEVVSLHVPLTKETEYMVNDEFISRFKNPFYLINTSRGKVVKTDDLVKHIKSGKILGAALDVLEYETSSLEKLEPKDLPPSLKYLYESDKVILTPHIAGWTYESNQRISLVLAEKIAKILK